MSWSFLTLSLLYGTQSLPPARDLCRCVDTSMQEYDKAPGRARALHGVSYYSEQKSASPVQKEGETRHLRLRRWKAAAPLQWLLHTFIFYKPRDPPCHCFSYIRTCRISLRPKPITTRTRYGGAVFAHKSGHCFSSDSDNKMEESSLAWQQTNQYEEHPRRLEKE